MKLIVGLGNIGPEYESTRHNVGFMVVDKFVEKLDVNWSKSKFAGEVYINEDFILAKPHTFMNLSGKFINELIKYYKINIDDILIVYDDIYTDLGKVKVKTKGSSGGHNGINSIITELKSEEFKRIKIGIGKPANPKMDLSSYVLGKFTKAEITIMNKIIEKTIDTITTFIYNDIKIITSGFYVDKK
ncbi:MAG: aminoacyl-tRNA hydrolase [Metamycoplasmataceae bacterium]